MEYVEGQALDEHLKYIHFTGQMAEGRIREIIDSVLSGLAEVHKAGLLHRDIKPGNIYLKNDGKSMLIDFGSARQNVGSRSKSMSAIVSEGYAPPEQYSSKGRQGAWTDIYSIGAVIYKLIMGKKLEDSPHRKDELYEGHPDPLIPLPKNGYSLALLNTVNQCLKIKASERPQSVSALLTLLNEPANDNTKPKNEDNTQNIKQAKVTVLEE